jgi:hypothetical protein
MSDQTTTDVHASEVTEPKANAPLPPIAGGQPKSALIAVGDAGIRPRTMEELFIFAKAVINSGLAPRDFKTPEAVLVAVQMGMELGLPPMAALQGIAVINGRPAVFGDAMPGIVNSSGLMEEYKDELFGEGDAMGYRVTVKRKGRSDALVRTFTVAMAKKAGLWGKTGPWSQYPDRMLLMRARSWALRDAFPDVLKGMACVEEVRDTPMQNVTPVRLDELDAPKP